MTDHAVASADDLRESGRLVVEVEGREVGVFDLDGDLYACLNYCAHQGGPLCEGPLGSLIETTFDAETLERELFWDREGRILSCPWHGWEFDVATGECLARSDVSVPTYPVRIEDGSVVVTL